MLRLLLLLLFFLNFISIEIVSSDEVCSVNTELGHVIGNQSNTIFMNQTYCLYRGIRFALPPTGDRRFKVIFIKIPYDRFHSKLL